MMTEASAAPGRRSVAAGAVAVALATLVPVAGRSAVDPRVLVMPFAAEVDPAAPGAAGAGLWLGEAAAVLLAEGLAARGLDVITRDQRADAFGRLGLPASPTLTRATTLRIAELMGATDVVFGEVRVGAELSVRARLVRVTEGRELEASRGSTALSELFPLFDGLARDLAARTGYPLAAEPADRAPMPPGVFENYVKGLVAATPDAQRRFLESAMVEAPDDGRILIGLWGVYTALGAHDRALEIASATPADSPQRRQARFAVALSLVELGRLEGAALELEALNAPGPRPVLANALGVARLRSGPGGAAASTGAFAQAVELAPGNTTYLFNLGYAFARADDADRALAWLREAVRYDATDGTAHLVMSAVLARMGRSAEARREGDLARLLGAPRDPSAVVAAAAVPEGLERLPTSLDVDAAEGWTPMAGPGGQDERATAAFHLAQARRLIAEGRDRDADGELRRAIYLVPYEDEPHLLLGRLHRRAGRLAAAIDEFTVAIWCRETAAAHVALGDALLESGDPAGARRAATRALELDPDSADARALVARIGGREAADGPQPRATIGASA